MAKTPVRMMKFPVPLKGSLHCDTHSQAHPRRLMHPLELVVRCHHLVTLSLSSPLGHSSCPARSPHSLPSTLVVHVPQLLPASPPLCLPNAPPQSVSEDTWLLEASTRQTGKEQALSK